MSRILACLFLLSAVNTAAAESLTLKPNLAVLRCDAPNETRRFVGSSAPGHIFLPGEPVKVRLQFAQETPGDVFVEMQEITTRSQERIEDMTGFTDTGGHSHKIGLGVDATRAQIQPKVGDAFEVQLPLPERFGTYALILVHGDKRQFLGTVCRVPKSVDGATIDNTPIFGEFSFFDRADKYRERALAYQRMGIHGMRFETSWSEREDGTYNWEGTDAIVNSLEGTGIRLMVTFGGHNGWMWPFGPHKQTPASVAPEWDGNPYWGQSDWVTSPDKYPRYGKWITAFCQRYWKGEHGALWGLENYNEPWEGGGISGWARDCLQYRAIQKLIAESARKVDPKIKICAASSIMNTEDKFFTEGKKSDMAQYIDVFTDHYVMPSMSYGPQVAASLGKDSVETETWFVNSEYMLPQIVQFLASGQKRLSPWHPRVLYEKLPGLDDQYGVPTPIVAATAAMNRMIAGKPFEKIAFHDHLPWVFQFGQDADPNGTLVVFGQLTTLSGNSPKERLWAQVEAADGGTLTIDNTDGALKFFDLAGNPQFDGQKSVTVPMSILPTYVSCAQGPAAAVERLKKAHIEGKRPVEIIPHDFATRVDNRAVLKVTVHNCMNRAITGSLAVVAPQGIALKAADQKVELKTGERKSFEFPLVTATASPVNTYPFQFKFASDAGNAEYAEVLNAAIIAKGTKNVDGNLDDWNDVPGITLVAVASEAELTEKMRRPWLELKDQIPDGTFGEFKLAWDDQNLYVAARVFDQTPTPPSPKMAGRDENKYFHSAESDSKSPYKEFLKDFPGRSFAEVPYVYADSPESPRNKSLPVIPYRRDRLHLAFDVTDGWHDMKSDEDRTPYGFHAVPDTDYEYACYSCTGGESELWRLLAPGVPRIGDFPRAPRSEPTTGAVPAAKHVVKQDGKVTVYELSIPKSELADLKLTAGTTVGLMLRGGNDKGPHIDYGIDKAAAKINGLTLHPYWERSSNCGVRWTLVE